MIQRIFSTMVLFMLFGVTAVYGQQQVTQGTGAEVDASNSEKQELIQDIIDAKYQVIQMKYLLEKNRKYIENALQNIEDLEYKKAEFKKMQEELETYLNQTILRLEAFVEQDLPFSQEERDRRIAGLKTSMDNYALSLSEKLRQVFEEGLEIEAEYGKMVEAVSDEILTIDGVDTPVIMLRLGRVGMYYMTMDEEKTGLYNPETDKWETLPKSMNRDINLMVDIGQRTRTAEIVNIPLEEADN